MSEYKWLRLSSITPFVPLMEAQKVSEVARGVIPSKQTKEGFLEAYKTTKGSPEKMKKRLTGRNPTEEINSLKDITLKLKKIRKKCGQNQEILLVAI